MGKYGQTPWTWDAKNLRALIDAANIPADHVAKSADVSPSSLYAILQGRSRPTLGMLWHLADYFAVPLDFICGRCDAETARRVLNDYPHSFLEVRRAAYEQYMSGKNRYDLRSRGIESPYPYCLLDAIVIGFNNKQAEDRWTTVLSEEQERGLASALNSLNPRERDYLLHYYRDGETLEQIAKQYNITRERIRQVIARGLRRMRHPTRLNLIRFGADYVERESEYAQRIAELESQVEKLNDKRRSILRMIVDDAADALDGKPVAFEEAQDSQPTQETPGPPLPESVTLAEMDLSVRSYNCLARAGKQNLAQIIEMAKDGSLIRIRNFGRRSLEEVLTKIFIFTGKDYKYIYENMRVQNNGQRC